MKTGDIVVLAPPGIRMESIQADGLDALAVPEVQE